jgi:hypothetical protein
MRFLITFVSLIFLVVLNVNAQTTVSNVTVSGQNYDIQYNSGSYDSLEGSVNFSGISQWWGSEANAQSFADATNVAGVRFAHGTTNISGVGDMVAYRDTTTSDLTLATQAQAGQNYAISAVAVPAPLPILGILPVVGFLKRMRKRQRA